MTEISIDHRNLHSNIISILNSTERDVLANLVAQVLISFALAESFDIEARLTTDEAEVLIKVHKQYCLVNGYGEYDIYTKGDRVLRFHEFRVHKTVSDIMATLFTLGKGDWRDMILRFPKTQDV